MDLPLKCNMCQIPITKELRTYSRTVEWEKNIKKDTYCSVECCIEYDVKTGERWDIESAFKNCYLQWIKDHHYDYRRYDKDDWIEYLYNVYDKACNKYDIIYSKL